MVEDSYSDRCGGPEVPEPVCDPRGRSNTDHHQQFCRHLEEEEDLKYEEMSVEDLGWWCFYFWKGLHTYVYGYDML